MCKGGNFPCYAYRLANGRLWLRYLANQDIARLIPHVKDFPIGYSPYADAFYPRYWHEKLCAIPGGKPKGIFVCDMGELFGDWIPGEWQEGVFAQIKRYPQHRFYLLTKQPQNLIKFSPFPDNSWVGVTATDHEMYKKALSELGNIEAKVKYISFEPLLHRIGVEWYEPQDWGINWLIIGGQSGKQKFCPPEEWIKEIEDACDKARIPIFEKKNLRNVWYNYPRQEMPMEGNHADSRRTQER